MILRCYCMVYTLVCYFLCLSLDLFRSLMNRNKMRTIELFILLLLMLARAACLLQQLFDRLNWSKRLSILIVSFPFHFTSNFIASRGLKTWSVCDTFQQNTFNCETNLLFLNVNVFFFSFFFISIHPPFSIHLYLFLTFSLPHSAFIGLAMWLTITMLHLMLISCLACICIVGGIYIYAYSRPFCAYNYCCCIVVWFVDEHLNNTND